MPDIVVTPTLQQVTVTPAVQSLVVDETPALTIQNTIPIVYLSAIASSNTNMAVANSFYSGISIVLTAGTWLILGKITFTGGTLIYSARLSDLMGTVIYGSAEITPRAAGTATVPVHGIASVSTTTTVYLMGAASSTGGSIRATTPAQSLGGCTRIEALRVSL